MPNIRTGTLLTLICYYLLILYLKIEKKKFNLSHCSRHFFSRDDLVKRTNEQQTLLNKSIGRSFLKANFTRKL